MDMLGGGRDWPMHKVANMESLLWASENLPIVRMAPKMKMKLFQNNVVARPYLSEGPPAYRLRRDFGDLYWQG